MKVQILTAAVLAVLASRATFAASEGGDTWSELQPQLYARSRPPLAVPASAPASSVQDKYLGAPGRSEGGDTWSELQRQLDARSSPPLAVPAPAPASSVQGKYLGAPGRSEGGDTWSEVEANARSSRASV